MVLLWAVDTPSTTTWPVCFVCNLQRGRSQTGRRSTSSVQMWHLTYSSFTCYNFKIKCMMKLFVLKQFFGIFTRCLYNAVYFVPAFFKKRFYFLSHLNVLAHQIQFNFRQVFKLQFHLFRGKKVRVSCCRGGNNCCLAFWCSHYVSCIPMEEFWPISPSISVLNLLHWRWGFFLHKWHTTASYLNLCLDLKFTSYSKVDLLVYFRSLFHCITQGWLEKLFF